MTPDKTKNIKAFADACVDMNSLSYLEETLAIVLYALDDCSDWDLTINGWCAAVRGAIEQKRNQL